MPVVDGPVVLGEAQGGRLLEPAAEVLRSIDAHVISADDVGEETGARRARLRRERDRRARAAARRSTSSSTRRSARCGRNGRAARARRRRRTRPTGRPTPQTAQRAIEGFTRSARQGDRQQGLDRAARARCARRREGDGVDPALPALGPLGVRRRPGDRDLDAARRCRSSSSRPTGTSPLAGRIAAVTGAARGIGAVDRRDHGPRRRPRRLRRRPRRRRGPDRGREPGRRRRRSSSTSPPTTPPSGWRPTSPSATARLDALVHNAGHHPRQDARPHGARAVGLGARGQPRQPARDQRRAARARA